jgi:hypothetical protein
MEIIIALVVAAVVAYFIFKPRKQEEVVAEAPYKVEEPVKVEAQITDAVTQAAPVKKPRAKKATASKATAAKKPRAKKTTTK